MGPQIKGAPLPWLPDAQRMAETPCQRGCCWTPFGHSGAVDACKCHPFKDAKRG